MTRDQAEANWIWNPRRGDMRPPQWPANHRIRCTPQNIKAQQRLARCGTLIHTAATTSCPRKKSKCDQVVTKYDGGKGVCTQTAEATFIDNVNCLWCRRDYFQKGGVQ